MAPYDQPSIPSLSGSAMPRATIASELVVDAVRQSFAFRGTASWLEVIAMGGPAGNEQQRRRSTDAVQRPCVCHVSPAQQQEEMGIAMGVKRNLLVRTIGHFGKRKTVPIALSAGVSQERRDRLDVRHGAPRASRSWVA